MVLRSAVKALKGLVLNPLPTPPERLQGRQREVDIALLLAILKALKGSEDEEETQAKTQVLEPVHNSVHILWIPVKHGTRYQPQE